MEKPRKARRRLLILEHLLQKFSDQSHPLTLTYIIKELEAQGISAERKSLYQDFEALREVGLALAYRNGEFGGWFLQKRLFSVGEVAMLMDLLQASFLLEEEAKEEMLRRVASLASYQKAEKLMKQVKKKRNQTGKTNRIVSHLEKIQEALQDKKVLAFSYDISTEACADKQNMLLHRTMLAPYGTVIENGRYYLVGFEQVERTSKHYLIEEIEDLQVLPVRQRKGQDQPTLKAYQSRLFAMEDGEVTQIDLRVHVSAVSVLHAQFGKEISLQKDGLLHRKTQVEVSLSPSFYAWLFAHSETIELLSSYWVLQEYKTKIKAVLHQLEPFK